MAPRPTWKGYLKLSLVSCAVALYTATTTTSRIRFNIINRKTGNRVRNEVVDAETGEAVENEDRVKGYEVDKGDYVLLEDEELDEVALESTHTIDIEAFVPRDEVDEIYLDESFYIVPNDDVAEEAFAVIREAMKKKNMVGLARVVMYRRERLLMLQPRGKGIVATALRYKHEVRDEDDYFDDIPTRKVPADMLELAEHILEARTASSIPTSSRTATRSAQGADQGEEGRQGAADVAERRSRQRHQPDGRAAPQREGREGRGRARKSPGRSDARKRAPREEARRASAQAAEEGELRWPWRCETYRAEAPFRRHRRAARQRRQARRRCVRHPEARRDAAALRPAARARRRDEELGGDARPEPRAGREAARGPGRRPSDRIQQVRGHDPERRSMAAAPS